VEKGSAKYWILLNNASERAIRTIGEVAVSTKYDLVVDKGFLGALTPPLEGADITGQVLDKLARK
jgi:Skp family chaperone for outer membrane proteins